MVIVSVYAPAPTFCSAGTLPYVRAAPAGEALPEATSPAGAVPADVAAALREAARAADYEQLTEGIARLPAENAATAGALRAMAERYAYEEIETLLRAW